MKPTLIVLAAGMGSRYGGLKQLDPVGPGGEIILDYSVYDAVKAGFGRVVFVIREDIEEVFREQIGSKYEGKIEVAYAFQRLTDLPEGMEVVEGRVKPWGTAHAILACKELVDTPFGVINADDYYGPESFELLAAALRSKGNTKGEYVLVGYSLKNTLSDNGTVSRGLCSVDENNHMTAVVECHEIQPVEGGVSVGHPDGVQVMDGSQTVSMNFWGFTTDLFAHGETGFAEFIRALENPLKGEYYIPTLVQGLIDSGSACVEVYQSPANWLGVTYPEDKPAVQAGLKQWVEAGVYPASLWG